MMRIQQNFPAPVVEDVAGEVRRELAKLELGRNLRPGDSVAVPVGSRGIANLALVIKTVVEELKALGAAPFIVPAMGSHGGATAAGQRQVVEDLGVSEDYVGAPIRSSMKVVQVGQSAEGVPVYFDHEAHQADHVAVINRVKPHTVLRGHIQSGLHKMMLIGLGKHRGAITYHQAFLKYDPDQVLPSVGREVIKSCRVLFGLALVENPREETALVRGVAPQDFFEAEKELQALSQKLIPRLPFDEADLLIVDAIGKNYSGSGMDSNVVGRKWHQHQAAPDERPRITCIYVRDLSPESHGNATGIGRAEFAHSRLVDKIDREATWVNCITANAPASGMIPIHFDSDRRVLKEALAAAGVADPAAALVMRIPNTMELSQVLVSETYAPQVTARQDLSVMHPPAPMEFDSDGNLPPM
ncbi:MAG: lactate racemase domain-containing protein [Thermodesulfobacteriota bacterium]